MTAFISWTQSQKEIELGEAYTNPNDILDTYRDEALKKLNINANRAVRKLISDGADPEKIKISDVKAVFTGDELRVVRTVCVKP
jgi:hypothetical protein